MLTTMNDKMDKMSDEMHSKFGETNKEISKQNVRLVTVETTQRFMIERMGKSKGD